MQFACHASRVLIIFTAFLYVCVCVLFIWIRTQNASDCNSTKFVMDNLDLTHTCCEQKQNLVNILLSVFSQCWVLVFFFIFLLYLLFCDVILFFKLKCLAALWYEWRSDIQSQVLFLISTGMQAEETALDKSAAAIFCNMRCWRRVCICVPHTHI